MLSRAEKIEWKQKIIAEVLSGGAAHEGWAWLIDLLQKRPYTGVRIRVRCLPMYGRDAYDAVFTGIGFSKAHWPDPWDASYGFELAIAKAAADVVRQWDRALDAIPAPMSYGVTD